MAFVVAASESTPTAPFVSSSFLVAEPWPSRAIGAKLTARCSELLPETLEDVRDPIPLAVTLLGILPDEGREAG